MSDGIKKALDEQETLCARLKDAQSEHHVILDEAGEHLAKMEAASKRREMTARIHCALRGIDRRIEKAEAALSSACDELHEKEESVAIVDLRAAGVSIAPFLRDAERARGAAAAAKEHADLFRLHLAELRKDRKTLELLLAESEVEEIGGGDE